MFLASLLAVSWLSLAQAQPPPVADADAQAFADALRRMKAAGDALTEYHHVFFKREWINGGLAPLDVIEVRYRQPWDIHMKWTDGRFAGRELIYRGPEWNGGRFKIDPGPLLPVMNLHPDSRLARRGTRHSLYELPLTGLIDKIYADAVAVADHPKWVPRVTDEGSTTIRGEASRCFTTVLPKDEDPSLYANKVQICVNPVTGIPNALRVWDQVDGALQLVEEYDYIEFDAQPGFSDVDFEPDTYGL